MRVVGLLSWAGTPSTRCCIDLHCYEDYSRHGAEGGFYEDYPCYGAEGGFYENYPCYGAEGGFYEGYTRHGFEGSTSVIQAIGLTI
jgi:hypothetical protein